MAHVPRLFVDAPLSPSQAVPLSQAQGRHLFAVLRLQVGDEVRLFNGREGEWRAEVAEASKRGGILVCSEVARPQLDPPDLWLLFAPVKKPRTDFIVEKAVELGVARIVPVLTEYTNAERLRIDKMRAHVIEAAEQCGATFVPDMADPIKLRPCLADWDPARALIFCDEAANQRASLPEGPAAILIGPEGGFSPGEREHLRGLDYATTLSLGPRILRAETAAIAALTLWQSRQGDW